MKISFRFLLSLLALLPSVGYPTVDMVRLYEFGADDAAYLALPGQTPKASILLVPDAMATQEVVARRCDLLSKIGYTTLAVDFYNGGIAGSPSDAALVQSKISRAMARQTIQAALKMLSESPRYRSEKIIIAVWGANMTIVLEALKDIEKPVPLLAVSWLEADGELPQKELSLLPCSIQIMGNPRFMKPDFVKKLNAMYEQRGKRDSLLKIDGEPGFLLKPETSRLCAEAWSNVIGFWKTRSEDAQGVALPVPEEKKENPAAGSVYSNRFGR